MPEANKYPSKKAQALMQGVPMHSIEFEKGVALNNDQFGHSSLNLLYLFVALRTRPINKHSIARES